VARRNDANKQAVRLLLPVDRSGYAITAGYLGLFSLALPVGLFAIIFGYLALIDISKNPEKCGQRSRSFWCCNGFYECSDICIVDF
jgi:hypothetical protein